MMNRDTWTRLMRSLPRVFESLQITGISLMGVISRCCLLYRNIRNLSEEHFRALCFICFVATDYFSELSLKSLFWPSVSVIWFLQVFKQPKVEIHRIHSKLIGCFSSCQLQSETHYSVQGAIWIFTKSIRFVNSTTSLGTSNKLMSYMKIDEINQIHLQFSTLTVQLL